MALEPRYPIDLKEAAKFLSLSVSRVRELARMGRIACYRARGLRFNLAGLEEFAATRERKRKKPDDTTRTMPKRDVDEQMKAVMPESRYFS